MLKPYQADFIGFALEHQVLQFGDFKLKSGRASPYFFNLSKLLEGNALRKLSGFYIEAIKEAGGFSVLQVDTLFGPAYKGIPLASALALMLAEDGRPLHCLFDRKEAKDHGEGGQMMGEVRSGQRCLIVDDVLTAGTAVRASLSLLQANQVEAAGLLVAFDRQERSQKDNPASSRSQLELRGLKVISIVDVTAVMDWLALEGGADAKRSYQDMVAYRKTYGGS